MSPRKKNPQKKSKTLRALRDYQDIALSESDDQRGCVWHTGSRKGRSEIARDRRLISVQPRHACFSGSTPTRLAAGNIACL